MAGELRRGPWTVEEDLQLVNYVDAHGEGRWNSLARSAGLKRTGKSCRLRWLNYLRPDLRRGNITPQEQLLILELHSRWGNRWSKIAQHLPGRTDNEIKNYWRTRVQKHAKQLKCDVNSQQFKDVMRYLWMPRLVERIQAAAANNNASGAGVPPAGAAADDTPLSSSWQHGGGADDDGGLYASPELPTDACWPPADCYYYPAAADHQLLNNPAAAVFPDLSSTTAGSSSPSSDSGAGTAQPWPAPLGGAGAEWLTTGACCDASSAAAAAVVLGGQQQQSCLVGETSWASSELPELGVADFEIGSFDVESIWSMDDSLWFTQAQGV